MTEKSGQPDLATQAAVEEGVLEIAKFTSSPEFTRVMAELWSLHPTERATYVLRTLLNPAELSRRGVTVPSDLVIQRSAFRDNRPTLFCITKYLPPDLLWHKVTITFDNPDGEPAIRYTDMAGTAVP